MFRVNHSEISDKIIRHVLLEGYKVYSIKEPSSSDTLYIYLRHRQLRKTVKVRISNHNNKVGINHRRFILISISPMEYSLESAKLALSELVNR